MAQRGRLIRELSTPATSEPASPSATRPVPTSSPKRLLPDTGPLPPGLAILSDDVQGLQMDLVYVNPYGAGGAEAPCIASAEAGGLRMTLQPPEIAEEETPADLWNVKENADTYQGRDSESVCLADAGKMV
mmetsp:Transcript_40723/g.82085  ORF Transcript_40723/g.82085 Transcript_40723/m.82085 type:complete len:131 (+) Transcript_40723:40-432(+)